MAAEPGAQVFVSAEKSLKFIGKVVGAALGAVAGVPGMLVGLVIGHAYDEKMESDDEEAAGGSAAAISASFFQTTFATMGAVAKSDGVVSEREIAAARAVFAMFRLSDAQQREAIDWFQRGKEPTFALDDQVAEFARLCGGRRDLKLFFLEIQLRAALLGNGLEGAPRRALNRVAQRLGLSAMEFARVEAVLRLQGYAAGMNGTGGYRNGTGQQGPTPAQRAQQAYELLGVSAGSTDAEVTKAYRRLMSQNHPDKLIAKGLPESMLEVAKQKTQAIQAAYEAVRAARGMR